MSDIPVKSRVDRGKGPGSKKKGAKATKSSTDLNSPNEAEDDMDSEHCLICAEKLVYAAYTPCHHRTCHKCSLRQTILYEKDICLFCRSPMENLVISDDIAEDKDYDDFDVEQLPIYDDKTKVYYTSEPVQTACKELLEYRCSVKGCFQPFESFKQLQDHTKLSHNKYFCLICYNNKKAFISELPLYNYKSLQIHQSVGDVKSGFMGHPACQYCNKKRFYSEDELNIHVRDSHERCHICDQDNPQTATYYKNYDTLYNHFKTDHYVCNVQSCLDKKFVVFREDLDLTAHMLKEHGSIAGANNRIVFGAGRAYQSQLSTYSNNRPSNTSNQQVPNDYNLKKKRFEERAKHYLENNPDRLRGFTDTNEQFKSNSITVDDLVKTYKGMFKDQTEEEIGIILTEFAELFPESYNKHKILKLAVDKLVSNSTTSDFPILGGRPQANNPHLHGWGGSSSSSKSSSTEKFPALSKPKPQKQNVPAKQPIRYTTVVKQQPKPVSIHSFNSDTNYKPTYLESSSSGSSKSTTPRTASPNTTAKSSLLDSKFPTLEKKPPKRTFPRVNPVNVTPALQWGPVPSQTPPKTEDDWGIPIIDKRKGKQKKKTI